MKTLDIVYYKSVYKVFLMRTFDEKEDISFLT